MSAESRGPLRGGRRVLIVRLGAVGDVVRTLPLAHALRRAMPDAFLGWAVEAPSAPLLREIEALDAIHVLQRKDIARGFRHPLHLGQSIRLLHRFRREVRAARYELVLDAHGTFKAALAARFADAPVMGFGPGGSKELAHLLHDVSLPFPATPMTRVRRALFLGAASGLLGDHPPQDAGSAEFGLAFRPERVASIRAHLAQDARRPIVLFPFASASGQQKRWPIERHAALAARLSALGHRVIVAWGSPAEGEEARRALAGVPGPGIAPPTDLVELTELLRSAAVLVTGDTGAMHLAAAVGTPVVALFGPSDPVVNRPWGKPRSGTHEVLVRQPLGALGVEEVLPHVLARADSPSR